MQLGKRGWKSSARERNGSARCSISALTSVVNMQLTLTPRTHWKRWGDHGMELGFPINDSYTAVVDFRVWNPTAVFVEFRPGQWWSAENLRRVADAMEEQRWIDKTISENIALEEKL